MAKIVDGYTDEKNVYAQIIGEHNISMYGSGDYVLSVGECLGYDLVSNNEIRIKDGLFITQGRRGYIEKGTSDTCIIENGAQNVNRNDLIIIEYAKNEATLVESHTTKVIKGTPAEVAADPEIVTGDIQNGAVLHQMPLYRVKIEGLNIVAVEQMFEFGSVAAETVDPMLATKEGFPADALAVKNQFNEQNKKIAELESSFISPNSYETGTLTYGLSANGNLQNHQIIFSKPFNKIPTVQAQHLNWVGMAMNVSDITTTGFKISHGAGSGAAQTGLQIKWIASTV